MDIWITLVDTLDRVDAFSLLRLSDEGTQDSLPVDAAIDKTNNILLYRLRNGSPHIALLRGFVHGLTHRLTQTLACNLRLNVTNLTLLIGLPAVIWHMGLTPAKAGGEKKGKDAKPGKNAKLGKDASPAKDAKDTIGRWFGDIKESGVEAIPVPVTDNKDQDIAAITASIRSAIGFTSLRSSFILASIAARSSLGNHRGDRLEM